jgi:hypothetical protein
MSRPAAYALVLLKDPGQIATPMLYPSGEHLPPSQGESPFPLDCYLSWMSPVNVPSQVQLDDLDHFSRQSISPASLRSDLDRNRRNSDRFHPVSLIDISGIRRLCTGCSAGFFLAKPRPRVFT